MKKKLVLKPFVLPTLYIALIVTFMIIATSTLYKDKPHDEQIEYVSDEVIDNTIPVVNTEEIYVINPYSGENIEEKVDYYNYQGDEQSQEKSIIKYDNTYLQNTGVTYSSEKEFNVVAIMDGEVTKIYESEILGHVIEITHEKNIISVYQMVDDISLKVGDKVASGHIIGKASTSKLFPSEYNLHFEVIKDGNVINPKTILGKNTKEL